MAKHNFIEFFPTREISSAHLAECPATKKERREHLAKVWKEFFFQGWALFFIYGLSFECNGLAVLLTLDPLGLVISKVRLTFMMDSWLA